MFICARLSTWNTPSDSPRCKHLEDVVVILALMSDST